MFKRIAVGFDGSRCANEAVHTAINLLSGHGAHISVIAVLAPAQGESEEDRQAALTADFANIRQIAETHRRSAESRGIEYHIEVVTGSDPAHELASIVTKRGFDLLVIGRHGRERAAHTGIGWNAARLTSKASCPVLVVGDGQHTL